MKKLIISVLILANTLLAFAATSKYQSENYNINVTYNDVITPGDAVFARMLITAPKNHKKAKSELERKATLQLLQDKKVIEAAPFYSLSKSKKGTSNEMLCGIPVSLWLTEGNYSLKIIFTSPDDEVKEFILPSYFKMRNFNKETLVLDEKNSQIRADNSPERMAQIEKLNNILFTTMPSDIYSLKRFTTPTESQRYTAWCGDRRIYQYASGKTSTSLHYGNDYGVPEGTEVRSCAEGRVVMAENRITTGWSIVIEHLPGLYSLYYHLSEMKVKEGDMVKQGELIGKSGSTGLATGPHLHWEIRLNGSAVCPEFFLTNFTFENE
ncbi:MAG: M23 family metallopeptidase [Treponema sp.]|nr:M23 family metallopeptidase [Treponema sp.]